MPGIFSSLMGRALGVFLIFCLPVALQIQIDLFRNEAAGALGLRINLADLFVPLIGIMVATSLILRQSEWPAWTMKKTGLWMALLTAVLIGAALHTYFSWDVFSYWAWGNKIAGFAVLVSLFYLGGWIGTNIDPRQADTFWKVFIGFSLFILITQCLLMGISHIYSLGYRDFLKFPIAGLMANRNAYAFLMLAVFIIALGRFNRETSPPLERRALTLLFFLMPFFWVYNGSRMGIITFVLIFLASIFLYRDRMTHVAIAFIAGAATICLLYAAQPYKLKIIHYEQTELLEDMPDLSSGDAIIEYTKTVENPSDSMRLKILVAAWEQIRSSPWIGSGLGSAFLYQSEKYGRSINLIDNTSLWLLTETGLLGFLVFSVFFLKILRIFIREAKMGETGKTKLLMLICFAVMSLSHEIMYTRFLWVMMGMWLAVPKTRLLQ
jgi:O-antigen ligase